jgi:outer membrane protein OmpA-like peptidoglycan-associated protein
MKANTVVLTTLVLLSTTGAWAQTPVEHPDTVPLYQVTVVERTVRAVDYQYQTGPTKVDFRGTVLLPHAKGDATVESKRGRTEVEAKFDHVPAPTRFGREYLTYVLWAITPQGHPKNLGEIVPGGSDKAKLRVTTDMQAFGLIVTAEPYSAVRQPSDVVVLENEIRPDTFGKTEPIQIKYDLLPRGHYTYNKPLDPNAVAMGAKLPFDQYEALLEVYQAQNAVQIAASLGAAEFAPDTYSKATQLLGEARDLQTRKAGSNVVVTTARQAAQTAEDARTITIKRKQDAEVTQAREQAAIAQQKQAQAEAAARAAQEEAAAARARLEAERANREQADRVAAPAPPPPPPAPAAGPPQAMIDQSQRTPELPDGALAELRLRMFQQLNAVLPTRDTPRGLVVTIADSYFHSTSLDPSVYSRLANITSILRSQPGLTVEVDGHTDDRGDVTYGERLSAERAGMIRNILVRQGLPQNATVARGLGRSRPIASNATASGREQNRRVEITISGSPIGNVASWERSYSVTPRQ